MCLCAKARQRSTRIGGWCSEAWMSVGGAVIGSCSVSASGFRSSSYSGAGSSCSCKAPVLRQTMKGVWKLSITRLLSRPHPWESFPVSLSLLLPGLHSFICLSVLPFVRLACPPTFCCVFLARPLYRSQLWEYSLSLKWIQHICR